ncbi:MAG: hypothetical protein ABIH42_10255 [Planctomycetota bacterium]
MLYKLLLQNVNEKSFEKTRDEIQKIFNIGEGQANDIIKTAPIVLMDDIADLVEANTARDKFQLLIDAGAEIVVTDELLEHIPRLRWKELPELASEEKKKLSEEASPPLTKYHFILDEKGVFKCPSCGEIFLLRPLYPEERQEVFAQAEILKRFGTEKPTGKDKIPAYGKNKKPEVIKKAEPEALDLASFEKGLKELGYGQPKVPEQNTEQFFEKLETLPADKSPQGTPTEKIQKEMEQPHANIPAAQRIRKKPFSLSMKKGERPSEEIQEPPRVVHTEGFHGVVIAQLTSNERRNKAAKLMTEVTGMPFDEARDLCQGVLVNVLREVSEEEAKTICQKFKDIGIMAKVTMQRRAKRKKERSKGRERR